MKVILTIASCFILSYGFGQVQALTFYPLKEWKIRKGINEVSYVLTKGTYYCIDTQKLKYGKFILQNAKRDTILTQEITDTCIMWRANQTGIYYLRFTQTTKGSILLGFNRTYFQFAKSR